MNREASTPFVAQLCPQCGLCCNGVLFADVKLQKGDDSRRLTESGLSLQKTGRQQAFTQPCACFDGRLCRIYADRPARCRTFECGLLKRVRAGELSTAAALEKITDAQQLVQKVHELLVRLGDRDEALALTRRYARIMREPVDLASPEKMVNGRGELMLAVNDLMLTLQHDFLK